MAHLQYIPGDPRLVDQLVYELKSKGIFDQFRKDCIADVDTRPAYQNLRQRVENSVSTFLSRQCWQPDLNKNQLREKLRKHILDGNYLEQGVERIVDQVVNPKVASVFIPQVEDLVYNYLGIARKKTAAPVAETSNGKASDNDLLPTDLEAVSPGSVKSNDDKNELMDVSELGDESKMDIDQIEMPKEETKEDSNLAIEVVDKEKTENQDTLSRLSELTPDSNSMDKSTIPLPAGEIKLENIPAPESSPPKASKVKVELEKIKLPEEMNLSVDIPLPEGIQKVEKDNFFKPINSDDDDSSSDSESLRRNMSPLTPIRNFNNENSCDAQQAFENEASENKNDVNDGLEPSTFRFTIEAKSVNSPDAIKPEKKDTEQTNLSYQFSSQVNINTFNTPVYDDSSNSNVLQIDYESDISKQNSENKAPEIDQNSEDSKKDKKHEEKRSSHKSSHRDSHRHSSSSKDKRSDSKQSGAKESSKTERKSSKDEHKSSSSKSIQKERSSDRSDKKDSRDSSKHRSSHKSSSSSSHKDSKSHKSSSSSQRHSSSSKHGEEKKSSSSSHRDKSEKSSDKSSKEKSSKDSKSSSSSHRSDKDRKSSSSKSKHDDKDKKKDKKETDDHYSASGRGNHTRRSTDRDSNDGSSSSKGSQNPPSAKSSDSKKEGKGSTSKSDGTSSSRGSSSPSDKNNLVDNVKTSQASLVPQNKPIIRVENHLEMPIASPPRLPFVPDVTLKKPKFAANLQEARKLMKMRKFLDEEQKRMNQEAALLLEFQANVRPSLSQVYSSIPGPELEFACVSTPEPPDVQVDNGEARNDSISDILNAAEQVENIQVSKTIDDSEIHKIDTQSKMENVSGAEVDKEVSETADKATVQVENVMKPEDNNVKMEIDTTLDDKNTVILKNMEQTDKIPQEEDIFEDNAKNSVKSEQPMDNKEIVNKVSNNSVEKDEIEVKLESLLHDDYEKPLEYFEVTVITEELSECEDVTNKVNDEIEEITKSCPEEALLKYFAEHEKFSAELERDKFSNFLETFTENSNKMYLINCDSYEENILKEVSKKFGNFEIVNYYKNGHLKLSNAVKNVVKNVNVSSEISLPVDSRVDTQVSVKSPSLVFSPVKSECSFELSSDYDAKLEEMVSKTSRKEIMEIILGNIVDDSTTEEKADEMPTIDYFTECNIESDTENGVKRKFCEVESSENNNRRVLTPNKIRKLSGSDQISSTTEESEVTSNNNVVTTLNSSNQIRSKYLGRAKRVGLPRPKRCNLPNSPSSDKSVENYEQNTPQISTPNGKMKLPRNKVQRYDTSDLYKPKLHYLSRRNNIS